MEFLEKGRGRPADPKRAINKDLIGKRVAREKQGRGEYDFAVRRVWEALERDKKAESWQGDLPSERTSARLRSLTLAIVAGVALFQLNYWP